MRNPSPYRRGWIRFRPTPYSKFRYSLRVHLVPTTVALRSYCPKWSKAIAVWKPNLRLRPGREPVIGAMLFSSEISTGVGLVAHECVHAACTAFAVRTSGTPRGPSVYREEQMAGLVEDLTRSTVRLLYQMGCGIWPFPDKDKPHG